MKKLFSLSISVLICIVLAGCSNYANDITNNSLNKETIITVSLPDDGITRTSYTDENGLKVTWAEGDKIAVFENDDDIHPAKFEIANISANRKSATFTGTMPCSTGMFTIVYPYKDGKKSAEVLDAVLKENQNGKISDIGRFDVMTGTIDAATQKVSPLTHDVAIIKLLTPSETGQMGVSIRGAWGDRLYYASSTNNISYIVVPASTNATKTLYGSVYLNNQCQCYEITKSTEKSITAGTMVKVDCTSKSYIEYPVTGIKDGHEYVTIDDINWATCNVGACVPWEYGGYYNWGMLTEQKDQPQKDDCYKGKNDIKGIVDYDVATYKWGSNWKMPNARATEGELYLLRSKPLSWTKLNNVYGCKFEGSDGYYVFLPAAGFYESGGLCYSGHQGYYWSSSPKGEWAWFLSFDSEGPNEWNGAAPTYGHSVRPIVSLE